jgi:HflK protein
LHVRWPWPIERVTAIGPDRVRSLEIGFRAKGAGPLEPLRWESTHGRPPEHRGDDEALLLTGDGRYVELAATLQFSIDPRDPEALRRYVFEVVDVEEALRPIAESIVRDAVGRRPLQSLISDGRSAAEVAAAQSLQERLDAYRFGIVVRGISFQDIHPPLAVVDAYRDVSRASSDRQRRVNEANAYLDKALAEAKGHAQAVRNAAEAARAARVALAASGADRFSALGEARRHAEALTDFRLFWEKVEPALAEKAKVVIDEEPGRRRHLILPNLPLDRAAAILP